MLVGGNKLGSERGIGIEKAERAVVAVVVVPEAVVPEI